MIGVGTNNYIDYEYFARPGEDVHICEFGNYVLIFPHKIWLHKQHLDQIKSDFVTGDEGKEIAWGYIDNSTTAIPTITMCKADAATYDNVITGSKPTNPDAGQYWLDNVDTQWLYYWNAVEETWQSVSAMYMKIESDGIGKGFAQYDAVTISRLDGSAEAYPDTPDLIGSHIIYAVEDNYIVVAGYLPSITKEGETAIRVSREMPNAKYIFAHKNRLWGCSRYRDWDSEGQGEVTNEIYASRLGDFKNWNSFEGISTDSWAATVGSGTDFTGACAYNDRPTFFKKDRIFTITGDIASEFRLHEIVCEGACEAGHRSIAVVNNILYYLSPFGIKAFNGSYPQDIGAELGEDVYLVPRACIAFHNKYLLWAVETSDEGEKKMLYEFDTERGIWHSTFVGDEYYAISATMRTADNTVVYLTADKTAYEYEHGEYSRKWEAESGLLTLEYPDSKYVSRIKIRAQLDKGAQLRVDIKYDTEDCWNPQVFICGEHKKGLIKTYVINNLPRRCDNYRMKLSGTGNVKLFSIVYDLEQGG